jgi:hypothetical protein
MAAARTSVEPESMALHDALDFMIRFLLAQLFWGDSRPFAPHFQL